MARVSGTIVSATIQQELTSTTAAPSLAWTLERAVWSATFGYHYNTTPYIHSNFGQRPFSYKSGSTYKNSEFLALCQANLPDSGTVTVSGTFTGNASADGPSVWMNGVPDTLTINGNVVTFGTHADKTAGGFKLRTSSSSYNTAGSNTWTATIDSNLQNIFKYNNAEGNP